MTKVITATPEPNMVALLILVLELKHAFGRLVSKNKKFKTIANPVDESGNAI